MTTITVHAVPGAVRRGLWCDDHALPHVEELTVWGLADDGAMLKLKDIRRCS